MSGYVDIRLPEPSADRSADIYGYTAVAKCELCSSVMTMGYPLWGVHLQAAMALHAAHRAVSELADIPAPTEDDRRFGRGLVIGPKP
jgi:hypothetical protein